MKQNIKDIDWSIPYEGYIWMSDQKQPKVYHKENIEYHDSENSFIIEGNLYNEDKELSIYITYVNGEQRIDRFDIKEMKEDKECNLGEIESFIPSIDGEKGLLYRRNWRKKKDGLCEDMMVWQPAEFIFIGFKK